MKQLILYLSTATILSSGISCVTKNVAAKDTPENAFSNRQAEMILSGEAHQPMRVYLITNYQDSILLRSSSTDVEFIPGDPVLAHFTERLYSTVRDSMSLGVGIAAPQVGILKNIIWVQRFDKEEFPFEVHLNPKIIQYSKKKFPCREGCLSIPERSETLNSRSYAILVTYQNLRGEVITEMIEDFTAVIYQHEVDHLNGILYIDHLEQEIAQAQEKESSSQK
jgi:peptide deformylase